MNSHVCRWCPSFVSTVLSFANRRIESFSISPTFFSCFSATCQRETPVAPPCNRICLAEIPYPAHISEHQTARLDLPWSGQVLEQVFTGRCHRNTCQLLLFSFCWRGAHSFCCALLFDPPLDGVLDTLPSLPLSLVTHHGTPDTIAPSLQLSLINLNMVPQNTFQTGPEPLLISAGHVGLRVLTALRWTSATSWQTALTCGSQRPQSTVVAPSALCGCAVLN